MIDKLKPDSRATIVASLPTHILKGDFKVSKDLSDKSLFKILIYGVKGLEKVV